MRVRSIEWMWGVMDGMIWLVSGEWLLRHRANGGTVILLRALLISGVIFLIGIGIDQRLAPNSTWSFDRGRLIAAVQEHLTWLGALFAGAYTALYTRFASQWQYLAGLYNNIMSTQAKAPADQNPERQRVYNNWKAAFIEDADNVHLALKPLYASLIKDMLRNAAVRTAFVQNTVGGAERLAHLEEGISIVVLKEEERWQKRSEASRARRKVLLNASAGAADDDSGVLEGNESPQAVNEKGLHSRAMEP